MKALTEQVCNRLSLSHICSPKPSYTDQESFSSAGIPSVWIAVLSEAKAHQMWLADNADRAGLEPGINSFSITGAPSPGDNPGAVTPQAMATAYDVVVALVRKLDSGAR